MGLHIDGQYKMGNTRIEDESLNGLSLNGLSAKSTDYIRGDYLGSYVMKGSASVHSSDKTHNENLKVKRCRAFAMTVPFRREFEYRPARNLR